MVTANEIISIQKLAKSFEKIYHGLDKNQLEELDKETKKIYPSEESEVFLSTDYSEEENSVGVSIYVSKPLSQNNLPKINFDKLMLEYLLRTDIRKLPVLFECIERMEQKGKNQYKIDFIPVFYTKELDKHDIHFRIFH